MTDTNHLCFGDISYFKDDHKFSIRHYVWYYGVLDKAIKSQPLPTYPKLRYRKLSSMRATVVHHFAWIVGQGISKNMKAKSHVQNRLRFTFAYIRWNLAKVVFLIREFKSMRSAEAHSELLNINSRIFWMITSAIASVRIDNCRVYAFGKGSPWIVLLPYWSLESLNVDFYSFIFNLQITYRGK